MDTQIAANRANQRDTRQNMVNYTPTSMGLPGLHGRLLPGPLECILPQGTPPRYQTLGARSTVGSGSPNTRRSGT